MKHLLVGLSVVLCGFSYAQLCQPGQYSSTGSAPCQQCAPGTFSDVEGSDSCPQCEINMFNTGSGNSSCTACPAGYDQSDPGQTSCDPCDPGSFNQISGSSCTACPAGTSSPQGAASCTPPGGCATVKGPGGKSGGPHAPDFLIIVAEIFVFASLGIFASSKYFRKRRA